jgi:hypothetical protein
MAHGWPLHLPEAASVTVLTSIDWIPGILSASSKPYGAAVLHKDLLRWKPACVVQTVTLVVAAHAVMHDAHGDCNNYGVLQLS